MREDSVVATTEVIEEFCSLNRGSCRFESSNRIVSVFNVVGIEEVSPILEVDFVAVVDQDILLTIWLGPLEGVSLDPSSALTFVFGTSKYVGPSLKMSSFVVEVSGLIVLVVVATRYVGLSLTILFVLIKIRDVEVEVVATSE